MPANPLTIAANFVQNARQVNNPSQAETCVDGSLADMKAAGIDERSAITMLSTALVSSAMNTAADHSNLIHAFIELEKRKAALRP